MRLYKLHCLVIALVLTTATTTFAQWVKQNVLSTEVPVYYLSTPDKNTLWTWTREAFPDTANIKKVEFMRTGDGGRTYRKGTLFPNAAGMFMHLEPLDGKTAHLIYATPQGEFGFRKTVDSGATWQNMPWQPTTFPNVVYFWDANNGIVSCDPDSLGMVVMYTTNGGNTFTRLPQTNLPRINAAEEFGLINEFQVVGNTIFMDVYNFATGEDRYWRSTDRGRNWTEGAPFSTSTIFTPRVAFSDENNGLLLRGIGSTTEKPLYTQDGGNTWQEGGNMPSYVAWPVDNVPGTNTFVALFQDTVRRMLYSASTNDLGKSWNSRKDIVPYTLDSQFVQVGGPPIVFSNMNILSNNAAWGRFTQKDVYRYDNAAPLIPEKPDLDLTITADNTGLPLWNYVKFTLTMKNRGISKATGIKANWLPPYKRTNDGPEPFAHVSSYTSKGNYNGWTGEWTVNELEAGESVTVTFHLFVVKNAANALQTAQITACNESDLDSAPNNMTATSSEDDEARFTSLARSANIVDQNPTNSPSVFALKISPNPAKDKAFVVINEKNETLWSVEILNNLGQVVFSKKDQQNGLLELNTEGFKNGLYLVHFNNGFEKRVEKLMVQH
jgi:photosystem II stability/assembly factor-like uncharacterized protein